ncbi:neuroblast differentiation-associated protein AHNAK-like [Rhinophrynus dorsalis]
MEEEDTRELLLPNWKGSGSMGLTLDKNEEGVFVKQLVQNSPAAKTGVVREGDQIVGATVYFDNMSSEDIEKLLANVGQHTVGLKLQRKGDKSPQPGMTWSHDVFSLKSPDVVLSGDDEEYRRIYTKKIKPRLKSDETLEPETQTRTITVTRKVTAYTVDVTGSKDSKEIDISSPEYKIKIPRHEITEISTSSVETDEGKTVIKIPAVDVSGKTLQTGAEYGFGTFGAGASYPGDSVSVHSTTVHYQEQTGGVFESPGVHSEDKIRMGSRSSADIDLPGISVSIPKFQSYEKKIDVKTSRFGDNQDVSLRGPSVAGASMDLDLKCPVIKGPEFDTDVKSAIDTTSPSLDTTSVTSRGGFQKSEVTIKGSQFDMKKPAGFKVEGSAISVKSPQTDINLSGQQMQADISLSDVSQGKLTGDLQVPKLNVTSGAAEGGISQGKIQMPKFQMPKFGISGPKMDSRVTQDTVYQGQIDLSAPQGGIRVPSTEAELKTAKENMSAPTVHVKGQQIGMDDIGGKIQMPSFKMPKFGISSTKEGAGESGVKLPHVTSSSVTAPDIQLVGSQIEGKIQGHGVDIKDPTFEISSLKVEAPGEDIKIAKGDTYISGPDIDVKGLEGKMKGPTFKMPSMNVNLPKVSVPDIDLNLKSPKTKGKIDISAPTLEGNLTGPRLDPECPKVDVGAPNIDIEGPGGKFKGPDLKMPSMNVDLPKMSMPDVDLRMKGSKWEGEVISGPKLEGNVKGPKVEVPDLNSKLPKVEFDTSRAKGDIRTSGAEISVPKLEADLIGPKAEFDLKVPEVDSECPEGRLKMPKFKMPKFGFSCPSAEGPNVDIEFPKGDLNIAGPKIDIETPDSKFTVPSMNVNLPKVSMPQVDLNFKSSKWKGGADISSPKLEGDLKGPKVDIQAPDIDLGAADLNVDGKCPSLKLI